MEQNATENLKDFAFLEQIDKWLEDDLKLLLEDNEEMEMNNIFDLMQSNNIQSTPTITCNILDENSHSNNSGNSALGQVVENIIKLTCKTNSTERTIGINETEIFKNPRNSKHKRKRKRKAIFTKMNCKRRNGGKKENVPHSTEALESHQQNNGKRKKLFSMERYVDSLFLLDPETSGFL